MYFSKITELFVVLRFDFVVVELKTGKSETLIFCMFLGKKLAMKLSVSQLPPTATPMQCAETDS